MVPILVLFYEIPDFFLVCTNILEIFMNSFIETFNDSQKILHAKCETLFYANDHFINLFCTFSETQCKQFSHILQNVFIFDGDDIAVLKYCSMETCKFFQEYPQLFKDWKTKNVWNILLESFNADQKKLYIDVNTLQEYTDQWTNLYLTFTENQSCIYFQLLKLVIIYDEQLTILQRLSFKGMNFFHVRFNQMNKKKVPI